MSRFGSNPEAFFTGVYAERAPWDIGGPQPDLEKLLGRLPPTSPILDLGCGSGDLAIWLAAAGHEVLGIDFVEAPIRIARERLAQADAEVRERAHFQVADALRPSALGRTFGAVVDSGFFHLFEPEVGRALAAAVRSCLRPGGRYYMIEFATEFPVPNTPRQVTPTEIRALFGDRCGWKLEACEEATFQSHIAPVPAICVCAQRREQS